jgi:hypothetical protein
MNESRISQTFSTNDHVLQQVCLHCLWVCRPQEASTGQAGHYPERLSCHGVVASLLELHHEPRCSWPPSRLSLQDDADNVTRFLMLARDQIIPKLDVPYKVSRVCKLLWRGLSCAASIPFRLWNGQEGFFTASPLPPPPFDSWSHSCVRRCYCAADERRECEPVDSVVEEGKACVQQLAFVHECLGREGVTAFCSSPFRRPVQTSIVFTLEEAPGALFKALAVFSLRDINLTKVSSSLLPQACSAGWLLRGGPPVLCAPRP